MPETDQLHPLAVENAELRTRLTQAERERDELKEEIGRLRDHSVDMRRIIRRWIRAYETAKRERDEARGLLREWQRMEQEGQRMSTADAIDAGLPDAWADMVEKRDDLLSGEGD